MHTQRTHELLERFALTLADAVRQRSLGLQPRLAPRLLKAGSSQATRPATPP